jgi:hypothetical protein
MPNSEQLIAGLALLVSFASFAYAFAKGRYDQLTSVRPALVFVYDHDGGWTVQNVGNGPALNVLIVRRPPGAGEASWEKPVRIPPLKRDGAFPLHWDPHDNDHALGAVYADMWGRSYTTTCARDLNSISKEHRLHGWAESEIVAEWALRKKA